MDLSDAQLEDLCVQAMPAAPREIADRGTEFRQMVESETLAREEHERRSPPKPQVLRTFRGPSGRDWMATVVTLGMGSESRRALRFTANDGSVRDLAEWPDDWHRLAPEQLVQLARRAAPMRQDRDGPRRRREDHGP
jgi:hypothetical protein